MAIDDVEGWLEDWVEENLHPTAEVDSKTHMARDASACEASALAEGIAVGDLKAAASEDLEAYLMRAQNRITDAHIRDRVQRDK